MISNKEAVKIIEETKVGYDNITGHFKETRTKFWADADMFAQYIPHSGQVLDLGCGSGRFAPYVLAKKADYIGIDQSETIIEAAKNQYSMDGAKFITANLLEIPCKDNYFDAVFSLATLHHIPSKKFQQKALDEIFRVLKPGGTAIITTWNLHANYYKKRLKLSQEDLQKQDLIIPWYASDGTLLMNRYVHVFLKDELGELVKKAGFKIKKIHYIKNRKRATQEVGHNLFVITQKP
ncbi:MAG: hypothetical protein CMI52_01955 [Parcubacteria group bacterium]|nr:hypothetical protein [Parcubacteria group bacterium]|tara:strand:- start:1103 stop:1810 length:708 start_codon:yes stop_codon:yes gene_type:complete